MQKIPTLFLRSAPDPKYVVNEVHPLCRWVLDGEGTATRKYDGTCINYDGTRWWGRREVKPDKKAPAGFVEVHFDLVTGKAMGWEPIEQSAYSKYVIEAHGNHPGRGFLTGTYELCGPRVNGNPEGFDRHILIRHDDAERFVAPRDFDQLAEWMAAIRFEGIVWHHPDGRMAKLKRRDFFDGGSSAGKVG